MIDEIDMDDSVHIPHLLLRRVIIRMFQTNFPGYHKRFIPDGYCDPKIKSKFVQTLEASANAIPGLQESQKIR
jgi:hypothetical protein